MLECKCGATFEPSHGCQKWCSRQCLWRHRSKARYEERKGRGECIRNGCHAPAVLGKTLCSPCAKSQLERMRLRTTPALPFEFICLVCGDLTAGRAGQKFCSEACRNRRRRVGVAMPTPEQREASRISEKRRRGQRGKVYGSAWMRLRAQVLAEEPNCYICGYEIDPDLAWPHPDSGTGDHVIPLSAGGPPLDRSNVRAAHLFCNLSKGNRQIAG